MLRHRNYLLAVLFAVQLFNSIDGMALGLVLQDIKLDLSLSDTQLSLLTGFGFSLMYSLAGIAIARWADRGNRVAIVALAAAGWSILVAAYGMGRNFVQLLLLRGAVGVCEAGCIPASQSLIADYFDRAERPRANAIYTVAGSVTGLIGYSLAGWLNQLYGWRRMFMMLGLPGLAVAALTWLTLRDPRLERSQNSETRGWFARVYRSPSQSTTRAPTSPSLTETVGVLWSNTTMRHLLVFWSVWGFLGFGLGNWWPAFFVRSYGLNTGKLGTWLAVVVGLGGTVGPLLGSAWVSRYATANEKLQLRAMCVATCGLTIVSSFMYLAPNYYVAFCAIGLYALITTAICGPFWAMVQTLVPEKMRATVIAMFMVLASLIGSGLGSFMTGALSDALRAQLGGESLRYASLALCPLFLWAAWHLWQAGNSVTRDLAATQVEQDVGSEKYAVIATATLGL